MDTLSDELWDLVIAGTGLPQSLLALSLSRSDLKILHVDRNAYYGGEDAGLSLDEVAGWTAGNDNASVTKNEASSKLASSRSYTLSFGPQIIYAQSRFLPTLVSSQIHTQLEFLAVGSFYVLKQDGTLQKIPSNREDVFADDTISMRDKRKLMNLLRHVTQDHDETSTESDTQGSLLEVLSDKFKVSRELQAPVQALSLSAADPAATHFDAAAERLRRHLLSVGYFGPGLGAVIAKYGSNSEIAQVACRASAVGGATYLLGHGVKEVNLSDNAEGLVEVVLSDGTKVKTKRVIGSLDDLPSVTADAQDVPPQRDQQILHQVIILSSSLSHLFAPLSENGTVPAAVIVMSPDPVGTDPPVYLQIHTHETGECPRDQVVLYASTIAAPTDSKQRLSRTIDSFIQAQKQHDPQLDLLWQFSYLSTNRAIFSTPTLARHSDDKILVFPPAAYDLAFDDLLLHVVKDAWSVILGDAAASLDFLRFEERGGGDED